MAKKIKKIQLPVESVDVEPIETTKEITMSKKNSTAKSVNAISDQPLAAPFTFQPVDGRSDLALLRVDGDEDKAPFYIDAPDRVHGICNALTHVWVGTYPVFEPEKFYFRMSREDAKREFGVESMGYIRGGEELQLAVSEGKYAHTKPIVEGAWYRVSWNGHRFTLKVVEWHNYEKEEPEWITYDRDALRLLDGLDDVYKAIAAKRALRLFFVESIQWALKEKNAQEPFVRNNDLAGLKERLAGRILKAVAFKSYGDVKTMIKKADEAKEKGEAIPNAFKRMEAALARKVGMVRTTNGEEIPEDTLIGKNIVFVLGATAIPGTRTVTTENFMIITRVIARQGYSVSIVE